MNAWPQLNIFTIKFKSNRHEILHRFFLRFIFSHMRHVCLVTGRVVNFSLVLPFKTVWRLDNFFFFFLLGIYASMHVSVHQMTCGTNRSRRLRLMEFRQSKIRSIKKIYLISYACVGLLCLCFLICDQIRMCGCDAWIRLTVYRVFMKIQLSHRTSRNSSQTCMYHIFR